MFHFALHSHNLEKDVPPSVLSSGSALSPNPVPCTRLQTRAFYGPFGVIEPGCAMRTGWSVRSPVRAFVPRHPDQNLEKCLSIWTEPCSKGGMLAPPCAIPSTNRPPFGYRERADAQARPTSSRLDCDQEAFLETMKHFRPYG